MLIAAFGDIHGNFDAFDAVLADIEQYEPDELVCVGDVVGYGAEPTACLAALRPLECVTVVGNHDLGAADESTLDHFNEFARNAALWTRDAISRFDADYLAELPYIITRDEFAVTHGTFDHPLKFLYLTNDRDAKHSFKKFDTPVGFIAHTHCPAAYVLNDGESRPERVDTTTIRLADGGRALINVGSVGQPRDEDPRACWVLYDTEAREIRYFRVPYDVSAAANKIRAAKLPEILAVRLEIGR